jgi:hypothetical protein
MGAIGTAPHSCFLAVHGIAGQTASTETGVALEVVAVRESLLERRQFVEGAVAVVHATSHELVATYR